SGPARIPHQSRPASLRAAHRLERRHEHLGALTVEELCRRHRPCGELACEVPGVPAHEGVGRRRPSEERDRDDRVAEAHLRGHEREQFCGGGRHTTGRSSRSSGTTRTPKRRPKCRQRRGSRRPFRLTDRRLHASSRFTTVVTGSPRSRTYPRNAAFALALRSRGYRRAMTKTFESTKITGAAATGPSPAASSTRAVRSRAGRPRSRSTPPRMAARLARAGQRSRGSSRLGKLCASPPTL